MGLNILENTTQYVFPFSILENLSAGLSESLKTALLALAPQMRPLHSSGRQTAVKLKNPGSVMFTSKTP